MQKLARHLHLLVSAAVLTVGGAAGIAHAQERTISLHNIHTKETVSVVYKRDGKFVPAGLEQVNHVMRDWRRNETTKMDPDLVDLLWEMHAELGSKEPIHIISGYRSRSTNDQLRRTVGGQASESRHILGKAADVHFPDVPIKTLRYSALVREKGGVGYYPTSAIPFVHVDTDRVRSWPRLPRHELALLFPAGTTRHASADGGPITRHDVALAQVKHRDLAQQIAQFHDDRRATLQGRRPVPRRGFDTMLAEAGAATKDAKREPGAASSSSRPQRTAAAAPSDGDRARLDALIARTTPPDPVLVTGPAPAQRPSPRLASLTGPSLPLPSLLAPLGRRAEPQAATAPAKGASTNRDGVAPGGAWVPAPEWDEEHPDELSYRPFSILPLLHAAHDAPVMSELVSHDVMKTLDMLDETHSGLLLRLQEGSTVAPSTWSRHFTGSAVGIAKLDAAKAAESQTATPAGRIVRTSQK